MSSHDRPSQSAENWKERQDVLVEERVRQFLANLRERQDKERRDNALGEFPDALEQISDGLTKYLEAGTTKHQTEAGVSDHHDYYVVSADQGLAGDPLMHIVAFVAFMQSVVDLGEKLDKVEEFRDAIDSPRGQETVEEIGVSLAEVWDQFKDGVGQMIEDVKQRMTELVSPEKTQDRAPIEQRTAGNGSADERPVNGDAPVAASESPNPHTGPRTQDRVQSDASDPAMTALIHKQTQEKARLAAGIADQRTKFANSPDDLKKLNDRAPQVEKDMDAKHKTELDKLLEQQQVQQKQISDPSDPTRHP